MSGSSAARIGVETYASTGSAAVRIPLTQFTDDSLKNSLKQAVTRLQFLNLPSTDVSSALQTALQVSSANILSNDNTPVCLETILPVFPRV